MSGQAVEIFPAIWRSKRLCALLCLPAVLSAALGCGPTAAPPASSRAIPAATEPSAATTQEPAADSGPFTVRVDGQPVTAVVRLPRRTVAPGEQITLTVELRIAPLWEIQAVDVADAGSASVVATHLELSLPPGVSAVGEWAAPPASQSVSPDGHEVYIGTAIFTRTLAVAASAPTGSTPIACQIAFQACNDRACLKPRAIELSVPLTIAMP